MHEDGAHASIMTDLEWVKKILEGQGDTLREHGKILSEIRDIATKTNGRVNGHDIEIRDLKKAHTSMQDVQTANALSLAKVIGGSVVGGALVSLIVQVLPLWKNG